MSIMSQLQAAGGCEGGKAIYFGARTSAQVLNAFKQTNKLKTATKARFKPLFPKLDLDRVRVRPDCILPGNWFKSGVKAMTFGYTIYCKGSHMQSTDAKLNILMHELVHVDQIRRRGNDESRFACDYGKGYLAGGGYMENPLEIEAYDFVTNYAF